MAFPKPGVRTMLYFALEAVAVPPSIICRVMFSRACTDYDRPRP